MATVKVKFRPSTIKQKEGTIYYQVIHNRIARQISTGYKIFPAEWDAPTQGIVLPNGTEEERLCYLKSLDEQLKEDNKRLKSCIDRLEQEQKPYTADQVVERFGIILAEADGFLYFTRNLIDQLRQIGQARRAEAYLTSINSFTRFRSGKDIRLEELDTGLIIEYEAYLKSIGLCSNSTSYYMRNLRAVYNRAVAEELTVQHHPFRYVYTGISKTQKRAIPMKSIRQIRDLNLADDPISAYARDLFMFSFYTRGMSFVDMAFLKKRDLQNGILSYRRRKTNQQLTIKWEKPMQEIIDRYDTTESPYLLPIIKNNGKDEVRQYRNEEHLINKKLKKIGTQLGLQIPLTTYVARHGWASIAQSKHIPIATISEAMGHDSEQTTRIYLASLDTSGVDKANRLIINLQ